MGKALLTDKPLPIGRLTRVECLALECLRACSDTGRADTAPCTALKELVEQAREGGFEIWRPEAFHVAQSELRLLSMLAISQRVTLDIGRIEPALGAALLRAAPALQRDGIKLGFGTITRVQPGLRKIVQRVPVEGRKSLRMKAIRHARERGTMSPREFQAIGVTRQYLSQLCARGDFIRIRPALYRAN